VTPRQLINNERPLVSWAVALIYVALLGIVFYAPQWAPWLDQLGECAK
jgi:hypothetical protein